MADYTQYRSYDDFESRAIYTAQGKPSEAEGGWPGWQDEYIGDSLSTPITAENLNAMLNMLIYIRNVIGKTTDFVTNVNGITIDRPDSDLKYDSNDSSIKLDKSISTYLSGTFAAIIGDTDSDTDAESTITRTLVGLKTYLESLDAQYPKETSKWINSVTQVDGKIVSVETSQPDASDITYTKNSQGTNLESDKTVDDALDKLDDVIGDLDSINFGGETATNTIDNLIAIIQKVINDRIAKDSDLLGNSPVDDESGIPSTITGVRNHIESLDLNDSGNFEDKNNSGTSKWINKLTQTDGQVYVEYSQPDTDDIINASDKYNSTDNLSTVIQKIVGDKTSETDQINSDIEASLTGLKTYLESLDSTPEAQTSNWINSITQKDGKIVSVETSQPDANDISVDNIEIKDKEASTTYSNLTDAINDESMIRNTQLNSVNDRIDTKLDAKDWVNTGKGLIRLESYKMGDETYTNDLIKLSDNKKGGLVEVREHLDGSSAQLNVDALVFDGSDGLREYGRESIKSGDIVISFPKKSGTFALTSDIDEAIEEINNEKTGILAQSKSYTDNQIRDLDSTIANTYATKTEVNSIELLDSKVKMSDNLRITENFGKYTPSSKGYVDIECKDKTVREFLLDALQVTSVGNIDLPSFSYTSGADSREGEVGDSYSAPTCTFKVTDVGSYQYGPPTGITFNGTLKTDGVEDKEFSGLSANKSTNISAKSGGTYSTSEQKISFEGTYSYTKGVSPNTNIETQDDSKAIAAKEGTLSHSCTYKGYYKMFMGIGDASDLTSNTIRALSTVNDKESKSTKDVNASVDDVSIIWAVRKDFTSTKPTFTYKLFGNYETLDGVVGPKEVYVKDGGGVNDVVYNVYTYTPAGGKFTAPMNTKITIN